MADVTIEPVPFEQKHVLGRLLQLYFYDFSEFLPLKLNAEGEYPYRYLDAYWAPDPGESRYAYFIRNGPGSDLAGFAMVRVVNSVNVMAEFCVLRPCRRGGIGSSAVKLLLEKHPGRWLIHEVATNLPAQAFWRRVIEEVTSGRFEEEREVDGGLTQRFEAR